MDQRKIIWVLAGLLILAVGAFGWSLTRGYEEKKDEVRTEAVVKEKSQDQAACASTATYARLKEVAFEEAVRLGNGDPNNLDTLAAHSVVRMENPVVLSRDEDLNVTVCSGRFILELPPGAEAAFGGQRRLTAEIEYAAQAAADGSGLVYQIRGAEPIVQKLAAFDIQRRQRPAPLADDAGNQLAAADSLPGAPQPEAVPPAVEPPAPAPLPPARPAPPPPTAERAPEPARQAAQANPSFNCRYARTRGETMVCSSSRLAAKDRAMSSLFYSALADADGRTRRALRRTRDNFLAYRDRCRDEACVAEAYDGRMAEIRDIMATAD